MTDRSRAAFPQAGVLAALYIPTDERGRVLRPALRRHLGWLKARGIHGILALGSTGEFLQFDPDQRKGVLETVAELAAPLPVIANISDLRPRVVAELGRFARGLRLPGVAVLPPHFYPVSPDDLLAFFLRAAEAADLPVLLYNFPELAANRIGPETVAAFADRAPLAAIKQSGGEFSYHRRLVSLGREKGFAVFTGADTRLPEAFALGVAGCIGGLVNFIPEPMLEIFADRSRVRRAALPAAARLRTVGALLDRLAFPRNVAAGLEARGFEPGAPKGIVSEASRREYASLVRALRDRFRSWKLPSGRAA